MNASLAIACAVCFSGNQDTLYSYYYTTILLTLVPLSILGGLVWYCMRKLKKPRS